MSCNLVLPLPIYTVLPVGLLGVLSCYFCSTISIKGRKRTGSPAPLTTTHTHNGGLGISHNLSGNELLGGALILLVCIL